MKKKNKMKLCALSLVGIMGVTSLTGCAKTVDCNIKEEHAHKYLDGSGVVMYVDSEKETYKGHVRTDDYILVDKEELELRTFEAKKGLYRIEENTDYIDSIQKSQSDFIEYRYSYTYLMPIPHIISTGKSTTTYFTYIPTTGHSWTTDSTHSRLTGEQRRVHYVYTGYKIERDEKGKLIVLSSEQVDSINDLPEEYKYIKETFYKTIDAEHGYDLDYEDGPESEHKVDDDVKEEYKDDMEEYEKSEAKTLK